MAAPLSNSEVLQLRMRAQLLSRVGPSTVPDPNPAPDPSQPCGPERIAAVTRHMLALQGQDWLASRWALGVRTPGSVASDVASALDAGLIVRSWPMRGTVHLVAAEDIGWVQTLTNERLLRGAAKRREFLGLPDATLERIVEVSLTALANGARLTREELSTAWSDAGIDWQPSWRYHIVWWLCQNGFTTLGPLTRANHVPSEPLIVLASDWITQPRHLTGDTAFAELATRYVRGHGPATIKDFAWWTGLTMRDAKRAYAFAHESGTIEPVELADAGPGWVAPELLGAPQPARSSALHATPKWQVLAAFDEHLLGYTDRRPQLSADQFAEIVPGRNGVFRATVVADGVTRGTWRRSKTRGSHIVATPLAGEHIDATALTPALERWARFHGFDASTLELTP